MRHLKCILAALALGWSAMAWAEPAHEARHPDGLVDSTIREGDVDLLFSYLRSVIVAAAAGREPAAPPQELEQRAAEIAAELKARGTLAALLMLSTLERQAKALIRREQLPPRVERLPPTVPYTRLSSH